MLSTNAPNAIEYRRLGDTGINLPAIGVGTQAWGTKGFGFEKTFTRDDLFAAYKTCIDAGSNFFDTSESYAGGMSEQLLGEFRRQDGRPILIGTKFSPFKLYDPSSRFSHRDIMPTLEGSLKRLGVQMVDLYQLHYPVADRKLDKYLDALAETVKTGKAKTIGVSNFNVKRLRHAYEFLAKQNIPLAANQIEYSLLYRYPESNGMLTACRELDVALIAILPLAEGILTGKYRVGGSPYSSIANAIIRVGQLDLFHQDGSKSLFKRIFSTPYIQQREKLEPLFELLYEVARAHNATIPQVALNWLLASHPNVIPIPGSKNVQQAADNIMALSWKLTEAEFNRISHLENSIWQAIQK